MNVIARYISRLYFYSRQKVTLRRHGVLEVFFFFKNKYCIFFNLITYKEYKSSRKLTSLYWLSMDIRSFIMGYRTFRFSLPFIIFDNLKELSGLKTSFLLVPVLFLLFYFLVILFLFLSHFMRGFFKLHICTYNNYSFVSCFL